MEERDDSWGKEERTEEGEWNETRDLPTPTSLSISRDKRAGSTFTRFPFFLPSLNLRPVLLRPLALSLLSYFSPCHAHSSSFSRNLTRSIFTFPTRPRPDYRGGKEEEALRKLSLESQLISALISADSIRKSCNYPKR